MAREADAVDAATREVLAHGLRPADLARPGEAAVGTAEMGAAIERAVIDALERHWAYHAV
jgi:hypothetical protein